MAFVAKCRIPYNPDARDALRILHQEEYDKIRKDIPELEIPESRDKLGEWYPNEVMLESHEIAQLADAGVSIEVRRVKGTILPEFMTGKYGRAQVDAAATIYQISVANIGLMEVRKVKVLENCCTDALQEELDRGWRIIAVCPPNDTRRPTYILGLGRNE